MEHQRATGPVETQMATVLYADDDETSRELGLIVIQQLGHRVVLARDGHEALALYEAGGSDLALGVIDMSMPGMGGRELIDTLRARGATLPLLVVTGHNLAEATVRGFGATGVLRKPFRLHELEAAVLRALATDEG